MQAKNLAVCIYNFNFKSKFTGNFKLKKSNLLLILLLALFLTFSFSVISDFIQALHNANSNSIYVADFKLDITKLSETVLIAENERKLGKDSSISSYGSDGKILNINDITPDLKAALINIVDKNNDEKMSNDEILKLKIMKLNTDFLKNELKTSGFKLQSQDRNLNNYIVITQGKYAGTVLYNGSFKFIDNNKKRYFGLNLYT